MRGLFISLAVIVRLKKLKFILFLKLKIFLLEEYIENKK